MLTAEVETRMKREHFEKYETLSQRIGIDKLIPLVPATKAAIEAHLASGDEHLNMIALSLWDRAVGYSQWPVRVKHTCSCGDVHNVYQDLKLVQVFRGLDLSPAECVCILKHVARYHVAENGVAR